VFQLEVQKRYRRLLIDREALPGFEIPSFRRRMSGAQSLPSLSASTYASLIPVQAESGALLSQSLPTNRNFASGSGVSLNLAGWIEARVRRVKEE
jgi:hypothetical protein